MKEETSTIEAKDADALGENTPQIDALPRTIATAEPPLAFPSPGGQAPFFVSQGPTEPVLPASTSLLGSPTSGAISLPEAVQTAQPGEGTASEPTQASEQSTEHDPLALAASSDAKSAKAAFGEAEPAKAAFGEAEPAKAAFGEAEPAKAASGEAESAKAASGEAEPAKPNSAAVERVVAVAQAAKKKLKKGKPTPPVAKPISKPAVLGDAPSPAGSTASVDSGAVAPVPSVAASSGIADMPWSIAGSTSLEMIKRARRRRVKQLLVRLLVFVIFPTLVATVFYGFVVTRQYESTCTFEVRDLRLLENEAMDHDGRSIEGVTERVSKKPSTRSRDLDRASLVASARQVMTSRDLLNKLDKSQKFLSHYQAPHVDFWSRLGAGREASFEYFRSKVEVEEQAGELLLLRVRAFGAGDARRFADAILNTTEEMLNQSAKQSLQEVVKNADADVKRLTKQIRRLTEPKKKAGGELPVTDTEGEEPVEASAPVEPLAAAAGSSSAVPQVPAVPVVNLLDRETEVLAASYQAAQARLVRLRGEVDKKSFRIVRIAAPSQPDRPSYPNVAKSAITVFLAAGLLLAIVSLLVAAVREHLAT